MNANAFIRQQMAAYGDSWKPDHEKAMACRDLEDAIRIGLAIYENINRRCEKWAQEIETRNLEASWDTAKEQADIYKWWLDRSAVLLTLVHECEKELYKVDGADAFRKAYKDVSLMSLDIDKNRRSLESLEAGKGTPAKEAMHALRCGLRPGCA